MSINIVRLVYHAPTRIDIVIVSLMDNSSSGEGYGFSKFPYPSYTNILELIICYVNLICSTCFDCLMLDTNICSIYNWSIIFTEGKLMEEQKEIYKEMLHEIIDGMDNAGNLLYLIIFIQEKFKAGE